jgi:hypothetical protein
MSKHQWSPPVKLSKQEQFIASRLKRTGKLFVFLRKNRHLLFDDGFRAELESMYSDAPRGTTPKDPALLAMVTLLQAYEQASDAAAVENAVLDRRWQMALDCLDCDGPIFSQGVLVDFRRRFMESGMDRRLLERTVELAKTTGDFGHKALRVALDSAPLSGRGRVEDTFNLVGHAMEVVVKCAAVAAGLSTEDLCKHAGLGLLGQSSIKAALDVDWDDPLEKQAALERLVNEAATLSAWVELNLHKEAETPPLKEALELLKQVIQQDIEPEDPNGGGSRIRTGTAKNRRISIGDGDMRHGRKSKSRVINGYKRHIAKDLDSGMLLAATVRPANEREFAAEKDLRPDVERLGEVAELHIDRGYLSGTWPKELYAKGKLVLSRPWSSSGKCFPKSDFRFDFQARTATCPAGATAPIRGGKNGMRYTVRFPTASCRACPLREQCIAPSRRYGRTLGLHQSEPLLQDLRDLKQTPQGRARLRERVAVEHALAHVTARQGPRARYVGVRKNQFDARRIATIVNLHQLQQQDLQREAA